MSTLARTKILPPKAPTIIIPQFLLPGLGTKSPLLLSTRTRTKRIIPSTTRRRHSSTKSNKNKKSNKSENVNENENEPEKHTFLAKPDKFRPPSHPARRVLQRVPTSSGGIRNSSEPMNYPGPKLSEQEIEEKKYKQYPHMFPPEGTVMFKFLTSRWIHVWIAMGVLTSLATFTFTTNFKRTSPYAHLLPPWSALISHPIDTISQALSVYRMDVQHSSMMAREHRHRRVEDAEKRRQFRIAHGLEQEQSLEQGKEDSGKAGGEVDYQSPVAVGGVGSGSGSSGGSGEEYVDWEGKRRPVKKWLGIW